MSCQPFFSFINSGPERFYIFPTQCCETLGAFHTALTRSVLSHCPGLKFIYSIHNILSVFTMLFLISVSFTIVDITPVAHHCRRYISRMYKYLLHDICSTTTLAVMSFYTHCLFLSSLLLTIDRALFFTSNVYPFNFNTFQADSGMFYFR